MIAVKRFEKCKVCIRLLLDAVSNACHAEDSALERNERFVRLGLDNLKAKLKSLQVQECISDINYDEGLSFVEKAERNVEEGKWFEAATDMAYFIDFVREKLIEQVVIQGCKIKP